MSFGGRAGHNEKLSLYVNSKFISQSLFRRSSDPSEIHLLPFLPTRKVQKDRKVLQKFSSPLPNSTQKVHPIEYATVSSTKIQLPFVSKTNSIHPLCCLKSGKKSIVKEKFSFIKTSPNRRKLPQFCRQFSKNSVKSLKTSEECKGQLSVIYFTLCLS